MYLLSLIRRVFSTLFSRELWIFLGLLVLSTVVWRYGSLLAIGQLRPLDSASAKIVLIALIALGWTIHVMRRRGRMLHANARIFNPLQRPPAIDPPPPPVVRSELSCRFEEAMRLLRGPKLSSNKLGYWLDRLTGEYAYRLPWYLVVGMPDAGKTSTLLHTGIALPMETEFRPISDGDIRATGECEWWFGNDAVLIDTPGRYVAPAAGDDLDWRELAGLLQKHRTRQPLNGILLIVGIDTLLAVDGNTRAADAARLRKKLQHIQAALGLGIPIYLIFTKIDVLAGFEDYFSALNRERREQVWGFTFKLEALNPAAHPERHFAEEFALLGKRLHAGLPDTLSGEPDLHSRGLAYLFPQEFASMQQILGEFYAAVCRPSRFENDLLIRGVYFTSARQGGKAIDRVLGPLRLELQADDSWLTHAKDGQEHDYFLRRLMPEVVLPEAGLGGINKKVQRRRLAMHLGLSTVIAVALLLLLSSWMTSYRNNRDYLAEMATRAGEFKRYEDKSMEIKSGALQPLSPLLNALAALPQSDRLDPNNVPILGYRLGLYQGGKTRKAVETVYQRALDEKLLPQAATRLHNILENATDDDMEYSYEALKAYLMLYDPRHYDPDFLTAWLTLDVEKALPASVTRSQRKRLEAHLSNLFHQRSVGSPFPIDQALINSVRERLAHYSLPERAYHLLRRRLLRSMHEDPITVASAGGPQASLVFKRKSGKPLTEGIPPLYSYYGYWDVFNKQIRHAVLDMEQEDVWVLGIRQGQGHPLDDVGRTGLVREVKRVYFNDYVQIWDAYLNDLSVVSSGSLAQSTQIARTLSAPDSPLKQFLQAAARETHLLRDDRAQGDHSLLERAQARIGQARQSLTDIFGNTSAAEGNVSQDHLEGIVDNHFEPLRRLVAGSGPDGAGPAPIDSSLQLINELYSYLTSSDTALASGSPPPQSDVFNRLKSEAGRMPMPFQQMMGELSSTGSTQVTGKIQRNITDDANATIGRLCRSTIAGRYPFAHGSSSNVALEDFTRIFAPGGAMDDFYQKNLVQQIDFNGKRWTFKPDAKGHRHGDAQLLNAFQNAETIRNVYFPGNDRNPSIRFEITPLELDPEISQFTLNVDGQTLRYAHGPQLPTSMKWPGPDGGDRASLVVSPQNKAGDLQTQGPWALHRLLDHAHITPGRTQESFVATFDFGGRHLSLRIVANSAYDPFHLPQMAAFACPR